LCSVSVKLAMTLALGFDQTKKLVMGCQIGDAGI
jgi:hypothetical protein